MIYKWDLDIVGSPPNSSKSIRESTLFWKKYNKTVEISEGINYPPIPVGERSAFIDYQTWRINRKNIVFWTDWSRLSPGVYYNDDKVIIIYTAQRPSIFLSDVLIHELGHSFGLDHCRSLFCIMSTLMSPGALPVFRRLCGRHQREIKNMVDDII